MSWMDSWSRPGKSQAVPAPYYLLPGGEATPYCRSCGRVISSRRATTTASATTINDAAATGDAAAQVKYCSARCRHSKPGRLDREIEETFARLLQGQSREAVATAMGRGGGGDDKTCSVEDGGQRPVKMSSTAPGKGDQNQQHKRQKSKSAKGESRILVLCDEVEEIIFGKQADPAKVFGRKKNRASRVIKGTDQDDDGGAGGEGTAAAGTANERLPSYGVTKFQTDSDDSAIELHSDDDDLHEHDNEYDEDGGSSGGGGGDDEHGGELRKSVSNSNNNHGSADGHTVASLSIRSGTRVRPAQTVSEVNGSVGGEKGWAERAGESEEMAQRRIEGQQRAQRKEMVRCAARRGVVFGFRLDHGGSGGGGGEEASGPSATQHEQQRGNADKPSTKKRAKKASKTSRASNDGEDDAEPAARKCEAVMQGKVVEPSYAKGNWGVRWRED
ncbi:hypothetical protein Micbo1qcDRAFT_217140 [Microdochium bolleyi]|uniref:Uncharacterized protein n=1 Tax=Microdochium bolleyi TaxID=196109 RepID=A0A136JE49_9PEZI|nr:hypothetical protein Micbo1qcDRAFT_217140 [Microdochium bolleyi]